MKKLSFLVILEVFLLFNAIVTNAGNLDQKDILIKGDTDAVYYYAIDGKRYVFPSQKTYNSWFTNFNGVVKVTAEELASAPLGGNVTYRPGIKLVKIQSDPKVYAVDQGGVLRWVTTEQVAINLYGPDWAKNVDDISVAFFINYKIGADVGSLDDFNPQYAAGWVRTINLNQGLPESGTTKVADTLAPIVKPVIIDPDCGSSLHKENGECTSNNRNCKIINGYGSQDWGGVSWGDCKAFACDTSFHVENSICISNIRDCEMVNGVGKQYWNVDTNDKWDPCRVISCNSGYESNVWECRSTTCGDTDGGMSYYSKGKATVGAWSTGEDYCEPNNPGWLEEYYCSNNTVKKEAYYCLSGCTNGACNAVSSCSAGYYLGQDGCALIVKSCAIYTGHGIGEQTWNGSFYSQCIAVSCDEGYELKNYGCEPKTQACTLDYGTGIATWTGSTWGTCVATSCETGFKVIAGECGLEYQASCLDFDGGLSYNTKSRTQYQWSAGWDECNGNILTEWYCANNSMTFAYVTCANGCSEGKCIQ